MRRLIIGLIAVAIAVAALFIWITQRGTQRKPDAQVTALSSNKVIPARAASPADDGNWTMPAKDYASTRFSGLNQLTPANVGKLEVAFTFSTGTTEGFEAPPLVVNNTMYVLRPGRTMSSP